jgi:hypothetical protein
VAPTGAAAEGLRAYRWAEKARTAHRRNEVLQYAISHPLPTPPKNWKSRRTVRRDPRKDQLLREMGLNPSSHG